MSDDLKLTAKIEVKLVDEALHKFENLLAGVLKSMREIDKESRTFLKSIPKGNEVQKVIKTLGVKNKKDREILKRNKQILKELNKEEKKRASTATKTAAALGGLSAKLARLRVAIGLVGFAARGLFATIAIPTGILAGWTFLLKRMADAERRFQDMARAVSVSSQFMRTMQLVADDAGLSVENVSDLIEELPNRIGDALENPTGGAGTILGTLGLDARRLATDLRNLGREKTFLKVVRAIQNSRLSDALKARAGDEIFGGEGNRFIASLQESGQSIDELIDKYGSLVQRSERAQAASTDFSKSFRNLTAVIGSLATEALMPFYDELIPFLDAFTKFLGENKAQVTAFAMQFTAAFADLFVFVLETVLTLTEVIMNNRDTIYAWGSVLLSVIKTVTHVIAGLLNWFSNLNEGTKDLIITLALIIPLAIKLTAAILAFLAALKTAFLAIQLYHWAVMGLLSMWGVLIGAIGFSLYKLLEDTDATVGGLQAIWEGYVEYLKILMEPLFIVWEALKEIIRGVLYAITGDFRKAVQIWMGIFDKIFGRIQKLKSKIRETFKEGANTLRALFGATVDELEGGDNSEVKRLNALREENIRRRIAEGLHKPVQQAQAGTQQSVLNSVNTNSVTTNNTSGDTVVHIDARGVDPDAIALAIESKANY